MSAGFVVPVLWREHVDPLRNETWVKEVRKLLSMADSKRTCLAPYLNRVLLFNGEIVSIAERIPTDSVGHRYGKTIQITIAEIISKHYEDIRIGHVNVFMKPQEFEKVKRHLAVGKYVSFNARVELYGQFRDRYGLKKPEFVFR